MTCFLKPTGVGQMYVVGFFLQSDSCEKISSGFSAKSCAVLNFNAIWQPVIRLAKMRLGIWLKRGNFIIR